MRGSEKLLALAIAGTLVAGIVVVLVRDVREEPFAQPTPTPTLTTSPTGQVTDTPTATVEPTDTVTAEPTEEPSPAPSPTRTRQPKKNGDLPDTGIPASVWFGLLMLAGAGLVYLELRRVY